MFRVSHHALDRALDMGVTGEEIRDAMLRPRDKFFNREKGSWYYTRGRVTLCVVEDAHVVGGLMVTTVIWSRASGWAADQAFGVLAGRDGEFSGARRAQAARRRKGKR